MAQAGGVSGHTRPSGRVWIETATCPSATASRSTGHTRPSGRVWIETRSRGRRSASDPPVTPALRGGCGLKQITAEGGLEIGRGHTRPSGRVRIETRSMTRGESARPLVTPALRGGCGLKLLGLHHVGAVLLAVTPALRGGCGLKRPLRVPNRGARDATPNQAE